MARRPKIYGRQSIKSSSKGRKETKVTGKMNLGFLLRKNRDASDVLYPYVTNADWVFDDMDLSVEEFSDITGADLDELIEDLSKVCKILK